MTTRNEHRTRGNQLKLQKYRANKAQHYHTFANCIVNDWNSLSDDVVTAGTLNQFKSKLNNQWGKVLVKFDPMFAMDINMRSHYQPTTTIQS